MKHSFTIDTDVLVLAVVVYDKLYKHTSIAMVSGNDGRFLEVGKTLSFQQYIKTERNIAKGLSTNETKWRRRSNVGDERQIGQLCMLIV